MSIRRYSYAKAAKDYEAALIWTKSAFARDDIDGKDAQSLTYRVAIALAMRDIGYPWRLVAAFCGGWEQVRRAMAVKSPHARRTVPKTTIVGNSVRVGKVDVERAKAIARMIVEAIG